MDPNQWAAFQVACQDLYQADNEKRRDAEQKLLVFQNSPDSLSALRYALESSQLPHVLMFASSSVLKLVTHHWGFYSTSQMIDLRSFLLRFLISRGVTVVGYVQNNILQTLARITKFGWFDDRAVQNIFSDIKDFMSASLGHHIMALNAFHILLTELNGNSANRTMTQNRRVAISFRDEHLYNVFQIAISTLRQIINRQVTADVPILDRVIESSLNVVISSLSYDFVGTSAEDVGDDITGTIQVPSAWRSSFEDETLIPLFFEFYSSCQPPRSSQVLQALTLIASVRRSLFLDEEERTSHLHRIIRGMTTILTTRQGLDDADNFHEFCRFLARIKSNFQLAEVVSIEGFQDWIYLVYQFTVSSLQSNEVPNSKYYLLGLWSRLVSALLYLRGDLQSGIEDYATQIIQLYITSKFSYVETEYAQNPSEDLLDDEEILSEQLVAIPSLGRCKYQQTTAYIKSLIDPLISQYQEFHQLPPTAQLSPTMQSQANILEGKLIWLVFVIGCMIGGRESTSVNDDDDIYDGILISSVMQLRHFYDIRLNLHGARNSNRMLELAVLSFLQHFRKAYLKDHMSAELRIFSQLREHTGLGEPAEFIDLLVDKIAVNLRHWYSDGKVLDQTLEIFDDLSQSYATCKQLLRLPKVEYMMFNHRAQFSSMLNSMENIRFRARFYQIIGRLFFASDHFARFDEFIAPFQVVCDQLLALPTIQDYMNDGALNAVVGFCKDARALLSSCTTRRSYLAMFSWIHPKYIPILVRAMEAYRHNPVVLVPLLKFMSEFVANRGQRITFDTSSADGILLFRTMSSVITTAVTCLTSQGPTSDLYRDRYKSVSACFYTLSRAISGGYANFGIFALYGDPALDAVLEAISNLVMTVPIKDILSYAKLSRSYFNMMEHLAMNHPIFFFNLSPPTFAYFMNSMHDAIKSAEFTICSQSCTCIDHLLSYPMQHPKSYETNQKLQTLMAANASKLNDIMGLLLGMALYEDGINQWTISRPLLTLIILSESSFETWKQYYVARQPSDRQQRLMEALGRLMTDVKPNIESSNRDQFTQNVIMVRQEVKAWIA
eukprot:TRINITY_DN9481_c0_g1_i1.p1 TRINITY_DN9481_c0_g1~~TRINITY_DN9481_c0_g1_i1.p1  ORF type:complete len:1063 (+),score=207.06 TRINITY_DN9481_c0_g1_i1:100-3288(+)